MTLSKSLAHVSPVDNNSDLVAKPIPAMDDDEEASLSSLTDATDRMRFDDSDESFDMDLLDLSRAMKQSSYGLQTCSEKFLDYLASCLLLEDNVRLAAGEMLLEEGKLYPKQLFVVKRGTLKIMLNDKVAKVLHRGDVLGKHTLVKASLLHRSQRRAIFTKWVQEDEPSGVTVQAETDDCLLARGGASFLSHVKEMKRDYADDFVHLEEDLAGKYHRQVSR